MAANTNPCCNVATNRSHSYRKKSWNVSLICSNNCQKQAIIPMPVMVQLYLYRVNKPGEL